MSNNTIFPSESAVQLTSGLWKDLEIVAVRNKDVEIRGMLCLKVLQSLGSPCQITADYRAPWLESVLCFEGAKLRMQRGVETQLYSKYIP